MQTTEPAPPEAGKNEPPALLRGSFFRPMGRGRRQKHLGQYVRQFGGGINQRGVINVRVKRGYLRRVMSDKGHDDAFRDTGPLEK
jgi:hypothetical protein